MIHWAIQALGIPAAEPVSLADAKNFCRVDSSNTADDAEISRFIAAARMYAEGVTARALVQTQHLMTVDRFPFPSNYDRALYSQDQFLPIGPTNAPFYEQFAIRLQRSPVVSIDSVMYVDNDGVTQTLTSDQYESDMVSLQCRLLPAFGCSWPIARYQANAVQVTFTAGSMFPVAADTTADTITLIGAGPAGGLVEGQGIKFYASGSAAAAVAGGLTVGTVYYALNVTGGGTVCQLAAVPAGAAINLTTVPTGVMLIDNIPETIRLAVLMHVAMAYESRMPGAVDVAKALEPINALLENERIWGSDV